VTVTSENSVGYEDNSESIIDIKHSAESRRKSKTKIALDEMSERDRSETKALLNRNDAHKTVFLGKFMNINFFRKQISEIDLLL